MSAIKNLEALMEYGQVQIDGRLIKIGDPGVTMQWVIETIAKLKKL